MKTAIVTGASSGMGRALVFQMADRFHGLSEIWVIGRRRERLEELMGQVPVKIRVLPLDVTKNEDRETLRTLLNTERPDVKILANAAGFGVTGTVESMDEETVSGMIRVNCEALCAVTGMVLPFMRRGSRILQFASAAAFLPQPGFAVYAATKAFVLSYSRALGAELSKKGIVVTAVCPGPVNTEFFRTALPDKPLAFYKKLVMAKPERVVKKALKDSRMGKSMSVYGLPMKGFGLLCKALPHGLLMKWIQ